MSELKAMKERAIFSGRLAEALRDAGMGKMGYTEVTREFNSRSGDSPVTVHAVRKWMVGEAIPSQEKLVVLAHWLAVNPHWLRYGVVSPQLPVAHGHNTEAQVLLRDFSTLDSAGKKAVRELVAILLKAQ